MEILIMGGTEFVSASVAKHLISKGYVVDIFTRGIKKPNYDGYRNHIKGDRKSLKELQSVLSTKEYDYVFDISAYTKEDTEKLYNSINKSKLKNYVFCSSGAVYKPSEKIITEESERGENENWEQYGLDKKQAEDYLFKVNKKEGFPITIFRPTYIYGEGNNLYRETYLFDRITNKLPIPIPAGNTKTQFIHIDDLVNIFESAMFCEKAIGKAYNVTCPEIVTWQSLVETVAAVAKEEVNIIKVDTEEFKISSREFFPFRDVTYLLDIENLKRDGLYVPKIELQDGLGKTYKWYCSNRPKIKDARMSRVDEVVLMGK